MELWQLILMLFGFLLLLAVLVWAGWLYIDRYVLRKHYLKVMILGQEKGIKTRWAKKTKEKTDDEMFSVARCKEGVFFYAPSHVQVINTYQGFVAYEKTGFALSLSLKAETDKKTKLLGVSVSVPYNTLEEKSSITLHAKIIEKFLDTKLIAEMLQKDTKVELILIIVCIALILIVGTVLFVQTNQIKAEVTSIRGNLSMIPTYISAMK